jgi:hypothetical protein
MPGLVLGIHVFDYRIKKAVDGRDKPGHDETMAARRGGFFVARYPADKRRCTIA